MAISAHKFGSLQGSGSRLGCCQWWNPLEAGQLEPKPCRGPWKETRIAPLKALGQLCSLCASSRSQNNSKLRIRKVKGMNYHELTFNIMSSIRVHIILAWLDGKMFLRLLAVVYLSSLFVFDLQENTPIYPILGMWWCEFLPSKVLVVRGWTVRMLQGPIFARWSSTNLSGFNYDKLI